MAYLELNDLDEDGFSLMDEQNKNSKLSELKKNTLIIGIATFGSKAISFILAPLYSYYLSTAEYGTMDLVITTASLLMPILMEDVYESVFRFTSDPNEDNTKVLTNCSLIALIGTIIGALLIFPISLVYQNLSVILIVYLYIVIDGFTLIFSWYERGCGKIKVFALSGVINSAFQLAFTFLFIVLLRYGLTGWYIGFLCAKVITFLYLFINVRPFKVVRKQHIDKIYQKRLLNHCIPLMPTTIMWWIMNASDRYVIGFFIGMTANGIYAVSNKIPSILNALESVFYQAYQTTAINSIDDKERNNFYSKIFNNYFVFMMLGYIGILVIARPVIIYLFDVSYSEAWLYIPPLLAGAVAHAISGNLGSYYVLFYQTKGALLTSFWGALTNILLNLILIPHFGLMAAALTTLTGYMVMFFLRWNDIKKFITIKLEEKRILTMLLVSIVQTALYFWNSWIGIGIMAVVGCFALTLNKDMLRRLVKRK